MLFRPTGPRGGLSDDRLQPGDILASGRTINASLTTAGSGTVLGAQIASGIIARTGPGGAFTDTFDTAWNIISALAGNFPVLDAVQGLSFEFTYQNQVAFAMTAAAAASSGVVLGSNVNVAASLVRDYLVTILNASPPVNVYGNTTNGSAVVTLVTPILIGDYDLSNNKGYGQITIGQSVYGTGIPAGATVLGLQQGALAGAGSSAITGFTLSANATATSAAGGVLLNLKHMVMVE